MSNIVHKKVMDRDLVRKYLVTKGWSIAKLAKSITTKRKDGTVQVGIPYGCVKNQAERFLTARELSKVDCQRRRYPLEEKLRIVSRHLEQKETLRDISLDRSIHIELVRQWVRQFKIGTLSAVKPLKKKVEPPSVKSKKPTRISRVKAANNGRSSID